MLTKNEIVDMCEVLASGVVQVRTATCIIEDGAVISRSFHRHCIVPGQDYSQEGAKVQALCAAVHTPECIDAYKAASGQQGD